MALTSKPLSLTNLYSTHQLEAINHNIRLSHNSTVQLEELEDKLQKFNCEELYATLHKDLTEKYNLNKEYYQLIEEMRQDLITSGIGVWTKDEMVTKLDAVVSTLEKNFTLFAEDKYRLLDEIFLIKTNNHWKFDLEELTTRVLEVLNKPNAIYSTEIKKILKIHDILELEENKLMAVSTTKKAQFYLE